MTDHHHGTSSHEPALGSSDRPPFDSEIDIRRAIEVGLWLLGTTIGTLVIGYFIYLGLGKWASRQDPTASPLAEANQRLAPPSPGLQVNPEQELAAMRAAERERLTSWGWSDRSLGLAHMPIEEAIGRLAVPEPLAAASPEAPASLAPAIPAGPEAHDTPAAVAAPAAAHQEPAH